MKRLGLNALKAKGITAYMSKDYDTALRYLRKSLLADPHDARTHYMMGNILSEKERPDEAIMHYQEALRRDPQFAEAYNNLGLVLQKTGRFDDAIDCYRKALDADPSLTGIFYNLGTVFHDRKQFEEAEFYYHKAVEVCPDDADAHYNLANVLRESDKIDEALVHYQKALALNPGLADAYNNMGSILSERGLLDEAAASFRKALQLNPNIPDIYSNMGLVFKAQGLLDKACEYFETALRINPSSIESLNNMAGILLDRGKVSEAEEILKKALRINPLPIIHSSLLFVMNYDALLSPQTIFAEHINFSKHFVEPLLPAIFPHTNEHTANRKLRIGYVSPDFRKHSVAYFIEPVLAAHDRKKFELYAYSDVRTPDEVTARIRILTDHWRTVAGMTDENTAELIRSDGIDILIDLAGHTEKNRMLVFARKPAPVQVTWIGDPATTGLRTMDYKIVDSRTDPPGLTEQFYSETLLRMPEVFLCYKPCTDSPAVGDPPSRKEGHITFGSFNTYPKVSSKILALWFRILKAVPGSRLILKSNSFRDGTLREELMSTFARGGIEKERIELLSLTPSVREHLNLYNGVDIALDTYPYNGTTTTCEALWMGVPVITLAGSIHASRVGTGILSTIGLPELVAKGAEEYIEKTVDLAHDTARLWMLRRSLRDMMLNSPLTDAKRFTSHLENCYRRIWGNWCNHENR